MPGANPSRRVPSRLVAWMQPFSDGFTAPTWQHALVLIAGAILSPGRRTVAAALRVMGLDQDPTFTNYHRVLNRNRWSSRRIARCLFLMFAVKDEKRASPAGSNRSSVVLAGAQGRRQDLQDAGSTSSHARVGYRISGVSSRGCLALDASVGRMIGS
jgi:DDE superfamily endonuclease